MCTFIMKIILDKVVILDKIFGKLIQIWNGLKTAG